MTHVAKTLDNSEDIAAHAEAAIAANNARIQRIEVAGQFYWVKHEEKLSLRMRLQKGDPKRAFQAERKAMHELAALDVPIPRVVSEGNDYFVTPDCGRTLSDLLTQSAETRLDAFEAAAKGLAGFHAKGVSHGRPSIKDIAWNGRRATFFDFERYATKRNTFSGHVQDVVILLFSTFAYTGKPTSETDILAETYRTADPGGIWAGAERFCRKLKWVDPLTRPIQRLRSAREFRAIPLTLAAFGVL